MPLAAVIPKPHAAVEIREFPTPDLEPNSALLAVELSEVCGTDVYLQQGLLEGVPYPLIPGHVSVGRLEKIRGEVLDVEGNAFREGDRVTFLDVHRTCNACWYCLVAKATTRCPHRKVYGITYGAEDGLSGGWAEQVYLKPGTRCVRLNAEPEHLMTGGCALPTALHAVERGDISIGDTVLVLGSGPVGLNAIILAGMRGALRVLCIGAPQQRLEAALDVGAAAVLNFEEHSEQERLEWVRQHVQSPTSNVQNPEILSSESAFRNPNSEILADVTIEATGHPDAVVQAMRFTRDAGKVVIVGQYTDHGPVSNEVAFNPHLDLNLKHLDVRGCWGSDFSHFYRAAQLINSYTVRQSAIQNPPFGVLSPWVKLQPKLAHFTLNQANEALAAVASGSVLKALIEPRVR
jgi:threonine dehydrogenase-like Zn-dependent dehydrogenase